ncbi:MAG: glutamate--tRNA ligase [Thermoprotei archaeon]|nr:MAG: glutamate--tRNA ligase [Thermoprotei archaeon]
MGEEPLPEEVLRELRGYALLNAVEHGGKAVPGPVISKVLGRHPELRTRAKDVARAAAEAVKEVNSIPLEEQQRILEKEYPELLQRKEAKEERKGLPPLPNVDKWGKVRTRFAPNPDFLIHLGNARPAILSHEYAKMYEGVMILRFEDTDPKTKPPMPEAYKLIKEDLRWLGVEWQEEYIQSLRMGIYYDMAKELIRRGGAYVDLCTQEEFRTYKLARKPCPHRNQEIERNLELFEKMINGHFGEGEAVLRVKTEITHKDPSVIDWVAFRIIDTDKNPHPIVGSRYAAWPTYNFAAGVDDHLLQVTHILRGKEHSINTVKQSYLYAHMGWEYPEVINLGRLKLEGLILSKSQIKKIMSENPGRFSGPDDIRFGTIASLRNRGIEAEAIRQIIMDVGAKSTDAVVSWDNIAAANRKLIDPKTKRLMAVTKPVLLRINEYGGPAEVTIPNHPDNQELGKRTIKLTPNNGVLEVYVEAQDLEKATRKGGMRLMEFCNVQIEDVSRDVAEGVYAGTSLNDAREKGYSIVQWVPREGSIEAEIVVPKELELRTIKAVAEPELGMLEKGEKAQLVRFGFIKIQEPGKPVKAVFIHE